MARADCELKLRERPFEYVEERDMEISSYVPSLNDDEWIFWTVCPKVKSTSLKMACKKILERPL